MEMVNRRLKLKIEIDMPSSVVCILQELEQKGYEAYIVGSVSGTAFWESVLKIGRSVPQLPRNSWPVYFPRGKWFPGTDGKPRDPADTSHVTGLMWPVI